MTDLANQVGISQPAASRHLKVLRERGVVRARTTRKKYNGPIKGNAHRGNYVAYGDYGLQALEGTWVPGRVIEGHVASVPPKMDEATRTAEVRVDVKDAKGLRPGMYAQAEVVMGEAQPPVLAIPQDAVQTVEGGPAATTGRPMRRLPSASLQRYSAGSGSNSPLIGQ